MSWWRVPLAGLLVALMLAAADTSAATRPSERACLMAWNAPANAAFRSRVAASRPWPSVTLRPGTISAVVWEQGSSARQTTAQACLMTLAGPTRSRLVVGNWLRGRVARWSFAGAVSVDKAPGGSNVKLLADGRVTKIYRR